jgi:hypothetical protein
MRNKGENIYSIDMEINRPPIRSMSASAAFANLAPGCSHNNHPPVPEKETFDADSSRITMDEIGSLSAQRWNRRHHSLIPGTAAISPLVPAYQSTDAVKISRMPFALFSYLHDDVLVLPPGFLNETSKG